MPKTAEKEYTTDDVSKHNTNDDCWLVIGNSSNGGPKVYDVTKYLDDHPGGAEVMLDVAGQNADEFFEDIGHSKEARKELEKYLIGTYKLTEEELAKMKEEAEKKAQQGGSSSMIMILLVALVAIYVAYTQMQG
eukprot:CAMPEP_0113462832 /NCGR_PEP_ID=MMETSP0014_2-20120614/12317_1 /TAXON_ID=2857 /ORGANISM="Nitzschia sp." /LENGTH=133 /DNA_ID=CAMNT_0000354751 /DNA_START=1064 /DNA_END=1465 /DNA_ORIENTATION=+ /assembly_acc=CAM_ASM_000159